jgi:hypothetical protein
MSSATCRPLKVTLSMKRHEEMLTWVGGAFDPLAFDVEEVNQELKYV